MEGLGRPAEGDRPRGCELSMIRWRSQDARFLVESEAEAQRVVGCLSEDGVAQGKILDGFRSSGRKVQVADIGGSGCFRVINGPCHSRIQ